MSGAMIKYDVAFSFAGEDRPYVDAVAHCLQQRGVKVFYDLFEQVDLWGKNLYDHLSNVYRRQARFTVMFISSHYAQKLWTNLERQAAQARAFQESREYILPARFDDTEIPGLPPTVGYIALASLKPDDFSSIIVQKLVSSGGTVPTELVRRDYSATATRPHSQPETLAVFVRDDEGRPIAQAQITAQAENGTTIDGHSNLEGLATLQIQTRRQYTLLIGHAAFPASMVAKVDPARSLNITLPRTDNVGSLIMHRTGHIPGLSGRLNPIRDTSNRAYLYADNIAINGGQAQPAPFAINAPFELEDANGTIVIAVVKHIQSRVALLQYTRR